MDWYKFGDPEGRYIGKFDDFHVYSGSISKSGPSIHEEKHARIPEEFDFMYGPATGGLMESAAIKFLTPGEIIRKATVYPDYKKRMISIRGKTVSDAILMVERINGFHSASHIIAFLSAVEDALGIVVDEPVLTKRITMIELERIRSNLEVVKRICEPTGLGVAANQIGYLREEVSRIISKAAGHRFFFGVNGLNSADFDISGTEVRLEKVKEQFSKIFDGLQDSKIFLNRLQTTGITKSGLLVGPVARASGMEYDARMDSKSLDYRSTEYKPVIRGEKDSFSRFMVRAGEVLNSVDIVNGAGAGVKPSGGSGTDVSGSGEGAARIESPQGDLFYYVKVKEGRIDDLGIVTPSALNIAAFEGSMPGNILSDFHVNWETFGIWISEMGVDVQ